VDKVQRFKQIAEDMAKVYEAKNADYGNSVQDTYDRYGAVSFLTRMRDKLNRLDQLLYYKYEQKVLDEKAIDTIKDLANYSIMFLMQLEEDEMKKTDEVAKQEIEAQQRGYKKDII
jgi:hypothetical protein